MNNVISRTGWEDVKSIKGSAKKGVVVFKKQYADWEALISSGPYAAHVIAGQDMNKMFLTSIARLRAVRGASTAGRRARLAVRKNAPTRRARS